MSRDRTATTRRPGSRWNRGVALLLVRILVSIGVGMVVVAVVLLLDLPWWVMFLVVVAAIAGMVWAAVTYRPWESLGRKVDPSEDPEGVWKRNPPGY